MSITIEAVTVCCGYSDFLNETARHNRHIFDRWVVVTKPSDQDTLEVCRRHSLDCLVTDEFSRNGDPFNKGRGIAAGMIQISTESWNLHIDADIVLPRDTRRMLEIAKLREDCIYGVDRIGTRSWDEWKKLEASGYLYDQYRYHMVNFFPDKSVADYEIAHRIMKGRFGWFPLGYFQLFKGDHGVHCGWRYKDYSDHDSGAAHSDTKFALQWDRDKRILIPEIIAVHIESERSQYGTNWKGRTTKPFGPPPGKKREEGNPYR